MEDYNCADKQHHFNALPGGIYNKFVLYPDGSGFTRGQDVWYQRLFCIHCAHVVEVIAHDHRHESKKGDE